MIFAEELWTLQVKLKYISISVAKTILRCCFTCLCHYCKKCCLMKKCTKTSKKHFLQLQKFLPRKKSKLRWPKNVNKGIICANQSCCHLLQPWASVMIMSIGTLDLFSLFFPEKATHRVDNLKYNFHATIFKQNKQHSE